MDRALLAVITAATAASAVACAPAVRSDRDESVPVPRGASWAWAADAAGAAAVPAVPTDREAPPPAPDRRPPGRYGPGPRSSNPAFDEEIFVQRFRRAVETSMEVKGYHKSDDAAQADLLLSFDVRAPMAPGRGARPSVMVGVGIGFGRPWGWYRPWGYYRPWGWFVPWGWGWGWYDMWGYDAQAVPGPGYSGRYPYGAAYRDRRLVVVLRERASGNVAWRASYTLDVYDMQRPSQADVQKLADKLLRDLP